MTAKKQEIQDIKCQQYTISGAGGSDDLTIRVEVALDGAIEAVIKLPRGDVRFNLTKDDATEIGSLFGAAVYESGWRADRHAEQNPTAEA